MIDTFSASMFKQSLNIITPIEQLPQPVSLLLGPLLAPSDFSRVQLFHLLVLPRLPTNHLLDHSVHAQTCRIVFDLSLYGYSDTFSHDSKTKLAIWIPTIGGEIFQARV